MNGLKKIRSIEEIHELGLNTHNMTITRDFFEAMDAVVRYKRFTIRTDKHSYNIGHWDTGGDLPFFMQKEDVQDISKYEALLSKLIEQEYYLIITDGIRYDDIQEYNAVVKIQKDGQFETEMSIAKVPLRKMYNYDGLFGATGNIADTIRDIEWFGVQLYDKKQTLLDVQHIYEMGIYNRVMELTKYPIKLGVKHDNFIYWQLR